MKVKFFLVLSDKNKKKEMIDLLEDGIFFFLFFLNFYVYSGIFIIPISFHHSIYNFIHLEIVKTKCWVERGSDGNMVMLCQICDLRPGWTNLRPKRANLRPERGDGGRTDE